MKKNSNIGGNRKGAGRPKGSVNKRTRALADKLLSNGKCPAEALVTIAEKAQRDGNFSLAVDAWKSVLPYVHAKPKPVEIDPDLIVRIAQDIADARRAERSEDNSSLGDRLDRAMLRLQANGA